MGTDTLKTEILLELIFSAENKETEDDIINAFLHSLLRKLNCFMSAVVNGNGDDLSDKQVYPFSFKSDENWKYIKQYIQNQDKQQAKGHCELILNDSCYYVYCLNNYGFLVIGRKSQLSDVFKNEFKSVVNYYSKLLSQSLENEKRKMAEAKLAEERRLLRTIIDNIPASIFAKDLHSRKTLANRYDLNQYGLNDESEVLGKSDFDLFDESLATEFYTEDLQVLEQGKSIISAEKKIGDDKWALISKIPLRDESGDITGLVGISINYTDRKKIQEQLSVFIKLFDNISDAIQVTTEEGDLFYVNKIASERLGIAQNEVERYKVTDYLLTFPTLDAWTKHVQEVRNQDYMILEGFNVNKKTGVTFPVEVTVKYVTVNGNGYVVAISRDITERKRAEVALKESEEKYRHLTESSSDVIWHLDSNYCCDYISPADERMRGFKQEEVLGQQLWNSLKPEGIDVVLQHRAKRLLMDEKGESSQTSHFEIELLKSDGTWLWTEISSTPHYDESGRLIGIHGSTRDISERKRAEQAQREIENRYRELVDNSPDAIVIYKNGKIVFVNNEGVRLIGASTYNELLGLPVVKFVHPDNRRHIYNELRNGFDDGIVIAPIEVVLQRLDGAQIEVEIKAMQIILDNELSVQLIIRDITSRKESEKQLFASEQKYRRITENMSDIVWTADLQFNMTFLSPSVEKMIGETVEEHIKRPIEEKFTPDSVQKIHQLYVRELENEYTPGSDKRRNFKIEVEHYRADKSIFWAEINMSIIRDELGNPVGIQGETRDISVRKKAEFLLQQTQQNYETFFNSIDDFIFVLDEEGNIIHINSTVINRLGYDKEELVGLPVLTLHPEERREEAADIFRQMLEGSSTYCPIPIVSKSGMNIPVETRVSMGVWNNRPAIFGVTKDISRLQLSEEKFSKSFFLNPSACGFSDLETGKYVEVNNAFYELLGFEKNEVIGKTSTELGIFTEEARQAILIYAEENGSILNLETTLRAKSGDIKHVLISAENIFIQDKRYRFTVVHDITALKEAEKIIHQYIDLQKVLINISTKYINIPIDDFETTVQGSLQELGEFVGADRAYIFDYDLIGGTTSNTYEWCNEEVSSEIDNLQQVPLNYLQDWLERHRKGEEFYVENVQELPDNGADCLRGILESQGIKSLITIPMLSNGNLIGFVGFDSVKKYHAYSDREKKLLEVFSQMLVNISERKRNGMLLILQEEKYRNIISNMHLGIIEVDKAENMLFANQSFCTMSGYTLDELVGRNTAIFITSDEDEIKLKEKLKLREQGISDGYEIEVMNKSGERRWWFVSDAPNYNDKNELIGSIGIHLDITEQKKLAKELEAAKISAEYAAKAKEVFLANMSHEIRTPLNVISGMVRELGKENLSAKQRDFVNHADVATEHLLTIINNILDMSKIESGEFELYNKDFSVEAVVGDVRSILFSKAHEKNLEFRIHLSPDIAKAHLGDPGRLRQILINLLGNSIKFTEKGYVSLDIDRVAQAPNYQSLKFTVVDTGIGMSEEFMHRLFDKFTQEEGATNRRFEGTGLGMSISKELVQLMGGEIQVTSTKGEGTKICFELQLHVGEENRLVTKIDHKSDIEMAGARVLLVEDNEMNRFIAIQSLKQVGCVITETMNELDALEKVQSRQYDIVLMDIQMPILDGVEATKEIRSKYDAEIPIIALTANAFKHDIDLYLSVGMNDYLIKPYKESELLEKLGLYLRRRSEEVEVPETLYDLSQLRELSRGDEAFINKMLSVFKSLAVQSIEQLEHGVEVNDWQEINRTAHKIKPSIDNLQINVISDKIRIVEKATEDQMTVDELKENVSEVITVLKKVVVSID